MNIENLKNCILIPMNKYNEWRYYKKIKSQYSVRKLSTTQKKNAIGYYQKNFGVKISPKYHELLYSISGVFRPEFMPFNIYGDLLTKLSPWKYKKVLDDKVLYDQMLIGFNIPTRICSSCNYVYYSYLHGGGRQELDFLSVKSLLSNIDDAIIKPSRDSSAGIGVRVLSINDGFDTKSKESIEDILKGYHGNFVVERKIKNNRNLSDLNPSSCNSLRVHTWRDKTSGTIQYISSFLRVGRSGSIVDNAFAGGIAIPVGIDGKLSNSGCTFQPYKRIEKSDTGIVFKGYQIEHFEDIIKVALRAHQNISHFDFIGWDITVDDNENVIIIEYNPDPDMRLDQLIFLDTCLLEHQKEILKVVLNNG